MAPLDRACIVGIERVEIQAKVDGVEGAARAARKFGLVLEHVGGAWAFCRPRDATLSFNRVMGLGLERPASPDDLADLKTFFGRHEAPTFRISLSTAAEPVGFETILTAAGFGTNTHWVKWVRDASPANTPTTDLRIERASADEAATVDEVLLAAFGHRPQSVPLVSALVGRPHWHHYVARDGDTPVAVATMYARDGFAWLGAAGTLASHRGRGAQGALIARRIDDARALGCHTLTTEILPDQPGRRNPSSRNMERVGFRIACRRPNWVFPDPVAGQLA